MNIKDMIHAVDPYEGFDSSKYPDDLQGWGGHQEFFSRMVELARPRLAIEVGSWKGRSAVAIAKAMDLHAVRATADAKLLCVDTWLGATEFWTKKDDEKRYKSLGLVNGYPTVYYQFLANMVKYRVSNRVVPFPQSSTNAARFLQRNGVKADLIYIDGSHEFEDVADDLWNYYPLLEEDGIICGDDYCEYWGGVIKAVNEFVKAHELVLTTIRLQNAEGAPSDYWIAAKKEITL